MPAPVLSGPQYLREGLKLVLSPGLRLFVLLPLAINLVLFVGLIYFAGHQFSLWVDTLMPTLLLLLLRPLLLLLPLLLLPLRPLLLLRLLRKKLPLLLPVPLRLKLRCLARFCPSTSKLATKLKLAMSS